jgi:hypothetical protein
LDIDWWRVRAERTVPDGTKLTWGFDPTAIGFFLEVRRPGTKTRCYDGLQPGYDRHRPLLGLLNFLVEAQVISDDDRDAVLLGGPEEDEDVSATAALAAEILDDLRRFAGD